jgi:hypothetical protein
VLTVPTPDLLSICITAFIGVFILLSILATLMRFILVVFPDRGRKTDAALLASVASVLHTVYPGTKITKIEEIR